LREQAVRRCRYHDRPVAGLERLEDHHARAAGRVALWHLAGRIEVREMRAHEIERRLEQRRVDYYPLARAVALAKCRERTERSPEASAEVADLRPHAHRVAVRFAGVGHQTGIGLEEDLETRVVPLRAEMAECSHVAIDQPRIALEHRFGAEAEFLGHTRTKV